MSAAKTARRATAVPAAVKTVKPSTITLPTLSSLFTPTQTTNTGNTNCNCGCCNQTSTTVCLTFDTSLLQSLVNMFPKINITNSTNTCNDPNCGCDDEESGQ